MTEQLAEQGMEAAVPFVMELYAQKARLQLTGERELLSSGMTGVIRVVFTFSEDWEGLKKTAVFSNGAVSIDVPEEDWVESGCTVPQQVLTAAGKNLMVGLFGTDGEEVALPTVWCSLGRVEPGAALSGTDAVPPEAPIWARLEKQIAELALDNANSLTVKGLNMVPKEDGSAALTLTHDFDQIQAVYREGYPVQMDLFGVLLPLTTLISDSHAEFTGAIVTTDGKTSYHLCTVPRNGTPILAPVSIHSDPTQAINDALAQAKASGEFDGAPGQDGTDGGYYTVTAENFDIRNMKLSFTPSKSGMQEIRPQIIALPQGPKGDPGQDGANGQDGAAGKTAYQYAKEGGYPGTESEFAAKLAADQSLFMVNVAPNAQDGSLSADKSFAEIFAAYNAGRQVMCRVLVTEDGAESAHLFFAPLYCAEGIIAFASLGTMEANVYMILEYTAQGISMAGELSFVTEDKLEDRLKANEFKVTFSNSSGGYKVDKTNSAIYTAVNAGKTVVGIDPLGRRMQLYRCSSNLAWFTVVGYDHDEETFALTIYRIENNTITLDYADIPDQSRLVQSVIAALPVYGGETQ